MSEQLSRWEKNHLRDRRGTEHQRRGLCDSSSSPVVGSTINRTGGPGFKIENPTPAAPK